MGDIVKSAVILESSKAMKLNLTKHFRAVNYQFAPFFSHWYIHSSSGWRCGLTTVLPWQRRNADSVYRRNPDQRDQPNHQGNLWRNCRLPFRHHSTR